MVAYRFNDAIMTGRVSVFAWRAIVRAHGARHWVATHATTVATHAAPVSAHGSWVVRIIIIDVTGGIFIRRVGKV